MEDRTGDGTPVATDDALLAAVHDEVIDYGVRRATATSIAKRAGVSRMTVYRCGGGVKQLVLDALSREFDTLLRHAFVEATATATATATAPTIAGGAASSGTEAPGIPAVSRTASATDSPGIPAGSRTASGTDAPGIPAVSWTTSATDSPGIPAVRDHLAAAVVVGVRALAGSTLVHALLRHDPELLVPYLVDRHGESQQAFVRYVTPVIAAGIADRSIRAGDPHLLAIVLLHALQGFVVSTDILRRELDAASLDAEVARLVHGYLRPDAPGQR